LEPTVIQLAGGSEMAFATADVEQNPGEGKLFKVVFGQDLRVLSEWQVNSIQEGERKIIRILRTLGQLSRGIRHSYSWK
jgi:hypothetical protein